MASNLDKTKARKIGGLIALVSSVYCCQVQAHVKWFVADEGPFTQSKFTLDFISFLVVMGALGFLFCAAWAEFKASPNRFKPLLYKHWLPSNYVYAAIQAAVLVLFLGNIIQGHFIAPNIPIDHHAQAEPFAQAALILLLVFSGELFALATLALCLGLIYIYGLDIAIDYIFELAAIALAVGLSSPSRVLSKNNSLSQKQRLDYTLTALRFGLGIQLCVLTFHDKLSHPGLALQFLAEYPYFNFLQLAGIESFSNLHFVLGAGLAEFCFGLLLVTNIAQRLASACICFFFTLSGLVLGPAELLGHIPIFTVAMILLLNPAPALNWLNNRPMPIKKAQI